VTRIARIAFGVLVLATVGAFFVTQKLKSSPPVIVRPQFSPDPPVLSPVAGARVPRVTFSFWILHSDDVDVSIVDADGTIVRRLASGTYLPRKLRRPYHWNGRGANGRAVPDGRYRVRVALRHQGRTIDLPETIAVDSRAPRPRVTAITPQGATGPAFLPQQGVAGVTIHLRGTEGRQAQLAIYRTDVTPARLLDTVTIPPRRATVTWDGTLGGAPAPAGTYLMALRVADRAGNAGSSPPQLPPRAAGNGHPVAGRAGVTIRYLAASPPLAPVAPGRRALVYVDARGRRYAWALRRLGSGTLVAHGRARAGSVQLHVRIPRTASSGLYGLTLVAAGHRTQVPLTVRADAARPRPVLVVMPALTWQGLNPVDDDGDGIPNTLPNGGPVTLARPFAHGMPASVADGEGALLRLLDDDLLRYDLTTDVALAQGIGATLAGHRGVILAGDERWLTPSLRSALRSYVEGGGRVWTLGTDALRRSVTLAGGTLSNPSRAPALTDALDGRPRQPLVQSRAPATMTVFQDGPLFTNTSGQFPGYDAYETLAPFPATAKLLAAAGPVAGTPVIAQWQLGKGFVVHTGLPGFATHALAGDLDAKALTLQLWTLLSQAG
jgi:hypothetical protein